MSPALRAGPLALLAWLPLACAGPPLPPPVPEPERSDLCRGIDNAYECARAVERAQLAEAGGRVERRGDTLLVRLGTGEVRRLVDYGEGETTVRLTYGGYLGGIRFHVVHVHLYEGDTYLLIDDDRGEELRMDGPPVVSPYATRVAVASHQGEAGYSPNTLEVWAVTDRGLFLEWAIHPDDWGAEDPRWTSPTTVRFTRVSVCGIRELCREPGSLRLVDGVWRVH